MGLFRSKGTALPTTEEEGEHRDPPKGRLESARERELPHFIIIGAQRAGTTSLHRYLKDHPDVGPSWRKEIHYFDRYYEKGLDWYRAHFPRRGKFPVVGEASPFYVFDPRVPGRIAETLGEEVRFVVMLRNPVDRAHSNFQMKVRRGIEDLSFEEAIAREDERLAASDDPVSLPWRHFSYLRRGLYAEQLERWLARFPRERFHVIRSEDFYAEPERILHEAQDFIGVDRRTPAELKTYNLNEYERMDPALRARLEAHFEPHNRRLYDLLGRDMGWER